MPIGLRRDPYSGYNFIVEIEGVITAGFTDVSGLSMETVFDTVKEGGVNDYEHKLPRGIKYSDITLKRGLVGHELWLWYRLAVKGIIKRKSGTIYLLDHSGIPVFTWFFLMLFPLNGKDLH